jgi:hypothetical protein
MTWTAPRTWSTGELVTAALLNEQIRDNLSYLKDITLVTFTSNVSVTGTAFVDIVSSAATDYGATPIIVEFYCIRVTAGGSGSVVLSLRDGATDLGRFLALSTSESSNPTYAAVKITPTAGSHTYKISAKNLTSQTSTVFAGAGGADLNLPGYIRIRGIAS